MPRMPDPGAPITTPTHTIADFRRWISVALRSRETPAHRVRQIIVKRRTIVNRLRVGKSLTAGPIERGFALPDVLPSHNFSLHGRTTGRLIVPERASGGSITDPRRDRRDQFGIHHRRTALCPARAFSPSPLQRFPGLLARAQEHTRSRMTGAAPISDVRAADIGSAQPGMAKHSMPSS